MSDVEPWTEDEPTTDDRGHSSRLTEGDEIHLSSTDDRGVAWSPRMEGQIYVLKSMLQGAEQWYEGDMLYEVVLLARDGDVSDTVIDEAIRRYETEKEE